MLKKLSIILIFIAATHYTIIHTTPHKLGPGTFAPSEPQQTRITDPKSFIVKKQRITPLAHYKITAKVLSKKNYYFDRESILSPTDLALGWGRMSDESIIESIHISQSGRWFRWHAEKLPISKKEIQNHSCNTHILPANKSVRTTLKKIRKGDIIQLEGKLIKATNPSGGEWISSLSRTDSGAHACEVVWVESLKIIPPVQSLPTH